MASRCSALIGTGSSSRRLLQGAARGMKIASARPVNEGKHVDIEFTDKTAYRFHTEWIKDSNPSAVGSDYYRKSAQHLFEVDKYVAQEVEMAEDGSKLMVRFANGSTSPVMDEYVSSWLHAFAPHVGQPLNEAAKKVPRHAEGLKGTGSLLEDMHKNRTSWGSDLAIPSYDAEALANDHALQAEFMEKMTCPGLAIVHGLGAPESLENNIVGLPMENLVGKIIGRMNQHPVRSTRYGVMHTRTGAEKHGADYDHTNPLSMHTDHSVYNGTPGYYQFMYQAQGYVKSKVCDGLALHNYMRDNHPEEYKLLTTVNVTHSSRNNIYGRDGSYKQGSQLGGYIFELVHTHPVITLDANGDLEKVVQSETKRGVSALPFETYEKFMAAYRLWTSVAERKEFICEFDWPEHSMVCFNNYRVLHGRASVPPNMERTMCFGYIMKTIAENRYRFLRQTLAERQNPLMSDRWTTRVPNQVLKSMVL